MNVHECFVWLAQSQLALSVYLLCILLIAKLLTRHYDHLKYTFLRMTLLAVALLPLILPWTPSFSRILEIIGIDTASAIDDAVVKVENNAGPIEGEVVAVTPKSVPIWQAVLFWGWLAVAGILTGYTIFGYAYICLFWCPRQKLASQELVAHLQPLREYLQIRRKVELRLTHDKVEPGVFGLIKPCIVLPESLLSNFSPQELRWFFLHELTHIRRWDQITILLQRFVQAIYFFHPLVWLLSRTLSHTMEITCDAEVTRREKNGLDYARAIVRFLEVAGRPPHYFAIGYFSHIKTRIRKLVARESIYQANLRRKGTVISMAILLFLAATVVWGQVRATSLQLWIQGRDKQYGNRTTYKVTVVNDSANEVKDVEVVYNFPPEMRYAGFASTTAMDEENSPQRVTWKIADLTAGARVEMDVFTTAQLGTHRSIFLVRKAEGINFSQKSLETDFIGVPAAHLSGYDTEDPVITGKSTVYVIEVRSEGTAVLTNLKITNIVPENMEIVSSSGPSSFTVEGRKVVFVPVPLLTPGEKLVYRITARAIRAGSAKNVAYLRYDQFDKSLQDEEGTTVYE